MEAPQDMALDTVPARFLERCRTSSGRTAHREKRLGIWQDHTWEDCLATSRAIAMGLLDLGLERGDVVSILSEDNRAWVCADIAVQCAGGIVCGIYPTNSAGQVRFLLGDSASRFMFVENDEQLDKFLEIRADVPGVLRCIVFDRKGLHAFEDDRVLFLDELLAAGEEAHRGDPQRFEREARACRADDVAILIYTSGTTGTPKGAMISHENILQAAAAMVAIVDAGAGDEQLCFLPLSHILERMMSVYVPIAAGTVVNFAENSETVFDNLREVSPSFMAAVPRVWEKIQSRMRVMAREASPLGRVAFERAIACGEARAGFLSRGERVPVLVAVSFLFWDLLVLANLRRMAGLDGARHIFTGAAPISPDLVRWYRAIGLVMLEGYGLTESTGILTMNLPARQRVGSVGTAIPGVEIRIGPSGEVLARGPCVFRGYWNNEEATSRAFEDGWLHTGDVGYIDRDGFVWLTGRHKDIIITSGGKNVAPAPIENQLKASPFITDAVVIGNRRRFLSALVMIDQDNVETFALSNNVAYSDFTSMCRAPEVIDLIGGEVDAVNERFARAEQVRDFRLIDRLLLPGDEELTPTMKLKRDIVEERHRERIDEMYHPARESVP